jgi:hypothetical protein
MGVPARLIFPARKYRKKHNITKEIALQIRKILRRNRGNKNYGLPCRARVLGIFARHRARLNVNNL